MKGKRAKKHETTEDTEAFKGFLYFLRVLCG